MAIRLEQTGLARPYGRAALAAGGAKRAREREQIAIRAQEIKQAQMLREQAQIRSIQAQKESRQIAIQQQKESQQIAIQQQTDMKLLDAQLDLEGYERSKRWEIDKMELRSRMDFEREEQQRRRKLDSADNAIQQIDKEVLAGRMTEKEAYPIKQKLELSKAGVSVPISAFPGDEEEEDRYGVDPYWMRGRDAPEGTPERQLYEAKMEEQISGERRGVVPYYLDPEWLRDNRSIAQQVLDSKGIALEEDEIDALIGGEPIIEQPELIFRGYGKERIAEPTTKAEFDALTKGTRYRAPDGTIRIK